MDPTLHMKMGAKHLERVLQYADMVGEDGRATVHLTSEDWHVVVDTLFQMNTPREILPAEITDYRLIKRNEVIEVTTPDMVIEIEVM
jgi:hypothetical protein